MNPIYPPIAHQKNPPKLLIGSPGHLVVFLWSLTIVLLSQSRGGIILLFACLAILCLLYAPAIRNFLRPRWLVLFGILFTINVLVGGGEADFSIGRLSISLDGVFAGAVMTIRAVIILLAAEGLASSVDITELAGLFERTGLQGLGFSLGIAANLLPNLRQAAKNTWHSFWMRGGMRRQWWRGLRLFILTVVANALHRSEDIFMAAESRAFHPDRSRTMDLKRGRLDLWLIAAVIMSTLMLLIYLQPS